MYQSKFLNLAHSIAPFLGDGNQSKLKRSIDVQDRSSLTSILNKIPQGMKVRDKLKSQLRESMSIKASPPINNNFLKSLTNVNGETTSPLMTDFK